MAGILCTVIEKTLDKTWARVFQVSTILLMFLIMYSEKAKAETYYSFKFKTKDELKISVPAASYEEAYKKAYQECFQRLTKGEYPGEEAGLNIIDICANGKMK